jgi:tetratricopeptide (TPR) repeat protein
MPEAKAGLEFAKTLEELQDYQRAVDEYQKIIQNELEDQDIAHQNLGKIYGRLGQYKQAIDQSQKALKLNPDLIHPHRVIALSLFRMGKVDQAKTEAEKALRKDPRDIETIIFMSDIQYYGNNNPEKAISILQKALDKYPEEEEFYKALITIFNREKQFHQTRKIIQMGRNRGIGKFSHASYFLLIPSLRVLIFFDDHAFLGAVIFLFSLVSPFLPHSISLVFGIVITTLLIILLYQFLWFQSQNKPLGRIIQNPQALKATGGLVLYLLFYWVVLYLRNV